ncbi:hypothetical protein AB5J62_33365 [Amycolatopsis sp. cg5]|uniref:hypothetical protein n=1 Tax=Amycolatopsis sp. cg5 TaxID=3238802 RepID=UPI0035268C08
MTEKPKKPVSIGEKRLADADTDVIWQQLGRDLLLEISARDLVYMEDGVMFLYGPHGRSKYRKIIVKLNGLDLYEVEVGYLRRRDFKWVVVAQESNVGVESLRNVVRSLAAQGLDA